VLVWELAIQKGKMMIITYSLDNNKTNEQPLISYQIGCRIVKLGIISKGLQDLILKRNILKGMDMCKSCIKIVVTGASGGGRAATTRRERKGLRLVLLCTLANNHATSKQDGGLKRGVV
jgi:hypothetical protein